MKRLILSILIILFLYMDVFGQINRSIRYFAEIPEDLLMHLNKMGIDDNQVLNNCEGRYLNFVFAVSPQCFDFSGKKIGFLHAGKKSKADYFGDERSRLDDGVTSTCNGILYIFDEVQKEETGGYDAAIVYWSKFVIPVKDVIEGLKANKKKNKN